MSKVRCAEKKKAVFAEMQCKHLVVSNMYYTRVMFTLHFGDEVMMGRAWLGTFSHVLVFRVA